MKKKLLVRELYAQRAQVGVEISNILDEVEKRENQWTAEDTAKYDALQAQMRSLTGRITVAEANNGVYEVENRAIEFDKKLREMTATYNPNGIKLQREWTHGVDKAGVADTMPLVVNDIIKPLEEGLILTKVGLPVRTGMVGNYVWPVLGGVEATIENEKVALSDSEVNISAIKPNPARFGITIPITNQAINANDGLSFEIVKEQVSAGLVRALNRAMFCTEQINAKFQGPFLNAKVKGTFKGAVPTYKELLAMKANVLKAGVENGGTGCFVMSETLKAVLEATPIDPGSGKMIVENGHINGYPVFCTNYINYGATKMATEDENVGFGVFSYQPLNGFGEMRLIVNPYSRAKEDIVEVTLNSDWATNTLRAEAFGWMKCGKTV